MDGQRAWVGEGIGFQRTGQEAGRQAVKGEAGDPRLPGTLGAGVEGLPVAHSKWNVRESKSNCKPTCLGVYHSSMGSSLPLVLGKEGIGITRTFQRNLTFASLHH